GREAAPREYRRVLRSLRTGRRRSLRPDGGPHRAPRVAREPPLHEARDGPAEPDKNVAGAGPRRQVVDHLVVALPPFDDEALFPLHRVLGKRSVDEPDPLDRARLLHQRDDPARVEGPETEMTDEHADRRADPDRRGR